MTRRHEITAVAEPWHWLPRGVVGVDAEPEAIRRSVEARTRR